jgi:hypothetical protein
VLKEKSLNKQCSSFPIASSITGWWFHLSDRSKNNVQNHQTNVRGIQINIYIYMYGWMDGYMYVWMDGWMYGMVWYGMACHGMAWHGMVWYVGM